MRVPSAIAVYSKRRTDLSPLRPQHQERNVDLDVTAGHLLLVSVRVNCAPPNVTGQAFHSVPSTDAVDAGSGDAGCRGSAPRTGRFVSGRDATRGAGGAPFRPPQGRSHSNTKHRWPSGGSAPLGPELDTCPSRRRTGNARSRTTDQYGGCFLALPRARELRTLGGSHARHAT